MKVVGARRPSRAAFPVAGAKADAGMASYGLSAGLGAQRKLEPPTQRSSLPLLIGAEMHTQLFRRDFVRFSRWLLLLFLLPGLLGLAHAGPLSGLGDRSESY